ncbi:MAG: LamG domain-containing protein [Verrucomicrobiota bacterium]
MKLMTPLALAGLAAFSGVASAATIADLAHRWSFDNSSDSVGAANLTVNGTATLSGGALNLPGGGPRANNATLPIGATIGASTSLTVETWFTMGTGNGNWSKAWMFGTSDTNYMDFTPRSGDLNQISASHRSTGFSETNTRTGTSMVINFSQGYLGTVVYDANADLISLYLDGSLVGSKAWTGQVSDLGATTENYIGSAVGFGDGDFIGSVDEMRIWTTALNSSEVAANAAAGPNVVIPETSTLLISCLGGFAFLRRRRA